MTCALRLSFDAGSGVCLWSMNDEARHRFGVAVDHRQLPLSENTQRWLDHLIAWYDTSIDWDAPSFAHERWTAGEANRFLAAFQRGLDLLREELSAAEFDIRLAEPAGRSVPRA